MFIIDTGDKQRKRLAELRQFEVDLLFSHIALAKSNPTLYTGMTSANLQLVAAIADMSYIWVQNFAASSTIGQLTNWSPLFKREFVFNELLLESNVNRKEIRLHEGVPVEVLNLQYAQQKLLFTYCELASASPALASTLLNIKRSEAVELSEINNSNLLNVDSTQLLWSLPFRKSTELTQFFNCIKNPDIASFAFDLLRG